MAMNMDDEQFEERVRDLIERDLESRGAQLKSRQVDTVVSVFVGLVYGCLEQIDTLEERLKKLEGVCGVLS